MIDKRIATVPAGSRKKAPAAAPKEARRQETLFLIGRPTLKQFIRFVRTNAVRPRGSGALADQWRAAYAIVQDLHKSEAGLPDDPPIASLTVEEHGPLLAEFLQDPLVRHGFNLVPTEVAFVDLDRLVVSQKHIDLTHVKRLEESLGQAPGPERVFRACLAADHRRPRVEWSPAGDNRYVFMSESNDLRPLGLMRMEPRHLRDLPSPGDVVGVVGMAVGFGSNFLSVIHAENRLLLHNGSHRAYTLRKLGIKTVPCLVQHVSCRDELEMVALPEVRRNPDFYLKDPRPPMLVDYFRPGLHTVMRVQPRLRQVTVKIEVEESYVPALPHRPAGD